MGFAWFAVYFFLTCGWIQTADYGFFPMPIGRSMVFAFFERGLGCGICECIICIFLLIQK